MIRTRRSRIVAQPASRPRAAAALRRHRGRRAAAGCRDLRQPLRRAPSATSGCGRQSSCPRRWRPPGVAGVASERAARTWLPAFSALYMANGAAGVYLHLRGIARKPGGLREASYNLVMGPPLLAPGSLAMVGAIGLAAAVDAPGALSRWPRASAMPDTCPTAARTASRPTPPACRASGAGSPRRCTAATRTTTCSPAPATGTRRRAATVLARVEHVPPRRFFDADEFACLCAFCDVVLAQDAEPRIPVMSFVDAKLHDGRLDGFQHVGNARRPRHLARRRAQASTSRPATGAATSFATAPPDAQHELVGAFADGALHERRLGPSCRRRRRGRSSCAPCSSAFYAHPWAWNEIGFGGPAYPRGYMRLGEGPAGADPDEARRGVRARPRPRRRAAGMP